jgi:hypothetical protein
MIDSRPQLQQASTERTPKLRILASVIARRVILRSIRRR